MSNMSRIVKWQASQMSGLNTLDQLTKICLVFEWFNYLNVHCSDPHCNALFSITYMVLISLKMFINKISKHAYFFLVSFIINSLADRVFDLLRSFINDVMQKGRAGGCKAFFSKEGVKNCHICEATFMNGLFVSYPSSFFYIFFNVVTRLYPE